MPRTTVDLGEAGDEDGPDATDDRTPGDEPRDRVVVCVCEPFRCDDRSVPVLSGDALDLRVPVSVFVRALIMAPRTVSLSDSFRTASPVPLGSRTKLNWYKGSSCMSAAAGMHVQNATSSSDTRSVIPS